MKVDIVILVLYLAGLAILAYASFSIIPILSCDITCQRTIMPVVLSRYNLLNNLGLMVLYVVRVFSFGDNRNEISEMYY